MDKPIPEAVVKAAEEARVQCLNKMTAYGSAGVEERHLMAMQAALTAAQQQGQAVAFDRMLGSPAYPDARTDPFNALCTAPPSAPVVSEHVRRLVGKLDQWRACMSHNESYFGEQAGLVKEVATGLARAVDPIYPPKPEPTDPLAGVVIHSAAVPFSGATNPPTARDLAYAEARASIPSAPVGVDEHSLRAARTAYFNCTGDVADAEGMNLALTAALRDIEANAQQPAAVDEALRAEVARLKELVRSVGYETLARAESAEASNERLAEALRDAADDLDRGVSRGDVAAHMRARAALEQEKGRG